MPSIINTASALVAFSGLALASLNATAAPYNNGTTNGTAPAPYANGTNYGVDQAICDKYSGKNNMPLYDNGDFYKINCNQAPQAGTGTKIVVKVARRQASVLTLDSCIKECEVITDCVATAFNRNTNICSFYAGGYVLGADEGVDFAAVVYTAPGGAGGSGAGAGAGAGGAGAAGNGDNSASATITETIQSTHVSTIYQCASTVTDCPYRSYVTEVVDITTTYCPGNTGSATGASATGASATGASATGASATGGVVTATGAAAVCSSCPYSTATYTGYSSTVNGGGSTSYVPVSTVVVKVAIMTSGTASTTTATVASTGLQSATATTTLSHFTGAAGHVEAGMGFAAIVGAAALLI